MNTVQGLANNQTIENNAKQAVTEYIALWMYLQDYIQSHYSISLIMKNTPISYLLWEIINLIVITSFYTSVVLLYFTRESRIEKTSLSSIIKTIEDSANSSSLQGLNYNCINENLEMESLMTHNHGILIVYTFLL